MNKKILESLKSILFFVIAFCMFGFMDLTALADGREKEDNDSYDTANEIQINTTYVGNIKNKEDQDYYKVIVTANGRLSLKFEHEFDYDNGNGWDIYIKKYEDYDYKDVVAYEEYISDGATMTSCNIGVETGNIYYIKIVPHGYLEWYPDDVYEKEYKITPIFVTDEYYEREFNDSYNTANEIQVNTAYVGNIKNKEDQDYYKVIVTANGRLSLKFEHEFDYDNGNGWDIYIKKYEDYDYKDVVAYEEYISDGATMTSCNIGVETGNIYYIKIVPHGYLEWYPDDVYEKEYKITPIFVADEYYEREFNDSYNTANEIFAFKTYGGNIATKSDIDYYKLTASTDGTLYFTLEYTYDALDNNGWDMELTQFKNYKYLTVDSRYIKVCDKPKKWLISCDVEKGDTYYLRIVPHNYNAWYPDEVYGKEYKIRANIISAGTISDGSIKSTANSVTLSWSQAINAGSGAKVNVDGYIIYEVSGKNKYVKIADVGANENKYTIKGILPGTSHKYYVEPFVTGSDGQKYSGYGTEINAITSPKKVDNVNLSFTKKGKIKISYKKAKGATGYQIFYSTSKKGKYKKLAETKKTSYTSKLKKGKKYYFKVRGYCGANKICGAFSPVVSNVVVLSKDSYTYTGKAIKPKVKVCDTRGKNVKKSLYSVTYSKNKNVGTATIKVKFKDKKIPTIKKTFKIVAKKTKPSKKAVVSSAKKAYEGIYNYLKSNNYDLETMKEYNGYLIEDMDYKDDSVYRVILRSYTSAFNYYYVDKYSGTVKISEYVPGITSGESYLNETFNIKKYLK